MMHNFLQQHNVADRPLNILTVTAHERYQTCMCATGHNFYSINQDGLKRWLKTFAVIPKNYHELEDSVDLQSALATIPPYLNIDLVLSHHKFGSFQILSQLARVLNVPLISLEHTLPPVFFIDGVRQGWTTEKILNLRSMVGEANVFISEFSKYGWLYEDNDNVHVIEHGIDTELFSPDSRKRENKCLSVVNDWINRDVFCGYKLWEKIILGFPYKVLGTTPGLSEPAKNEKELSEAYKSYSIFVNTSQISPIPTSLLEAMSSGMCPISSATCLIPNIIENGVNGFISNDPEELKSYIKMCLEDTALATRIGQNARQTIIDRFPLSRFVEDWNKLFRSLT